MGRVPGDEELMRVGYHYLIVLGYLVFHTIRGKTILIHRIVHGARNYNDLL